MATNSDDCIQSIDNFEEYQENEESFDVVFHTRLVQSADTRLSSAVLCLE